MKRLIAWTVLAFVLALAFACKQETPPAPAPGAQVTPPAPAPAPAPATAGKKYVFAVIPKALSIPVFDYARLGAERKARELGNVEVKWYAPQMPDVLKQKEVLESFIAQRVDGIAISCLNGDYLTETINKAVEAGIPVVTWDSDAPKSKRLAFYGVNDFRAGEVMGEEVVKLLGGKGQVAIQTAYGADNHMQRLKGVKSALAKAPGIKIIEEYDNKDDYMVASQIVAAATPKYPDLAAWISTGGWLCYSTSILDPVDPAKTKVISFDTIPPAPQVMKQGKIQLMIGQKYFGWGAQPVQLLYNFVTKGEKPANPIVDSGVDVVTPQNLDEYTAKWDKMMKGEITQ